MKNFLKTFSVILLFQITLQSFSFAQTGGALESQLGITTINMQDFNS